MKKSTLVIIVAIVAVLAAAGAVVASNMSKNKEPESTTSTNTSEQSTPEATGTEQTPADTNTATETSSVSIQNFAYAPTKVTVKKGTKITWTNEDSTKHDVTPDNESPAFEGSELLGQGESYSFTFNTVGTYTYHCSPHPYMKGTVEVTE